MNILIFYHRIPIPTSGGIARIISSLAMELSKHSYNIWFLTNDNNMDEQNQYCCLYVDESLSEDSKVAKVVELCNKYKIDVIINEEPIDIYSMHSVLNRSAILCNCKLISCFHNPVVSQVKNIQYRKEFYLQRKKLFLLYKFLSRGFIRFFLLQLYRLKYYKKYYHIVKESSLVVLLCAGMKRELQLMLGSNIYNSKIIPNFCSIPKDIIPYKQKTNTIIWCGNTNFDVKRLDVALKVWSYIYKEFSGWKFLILGDGQNLQEAKAYAKELNLQNIHFLGRTSPDSFYRDAKLVWVTSAFESFSLVTLEALSYGCIPVVFDTFPAASELITHGENGFLIPPYNIERFVQVVSSLMLNESTSAHISESARMSSSRYFPDKVTDKWIELLNSL